MSHQQAGPETYCPECGRPYAVDMPVGIEIDGVELTIDGVQIQLSQKAAMIFRRLMRSRGKAVSRQSIFFSVWGDESDVNWKCIDIYVHQMRRLLNGTRIRIETITGLGYRLVIDDNVIALPRRNDEKKGIASQRRLWREVRGGPAGRVRSA